VGSERAVIKGKVSKEEHPDVVDQKRLGDWAVLCEVVNKDILSI